LPNMPTLIEHKHMRFLIFDAPYERDLELYLKEIERHGVTDVVQVRDPTYDRNVFEDHSITVHNWAFPDGDALPANIVAAWVKLVESKFGVKTKSSDNIAKPKKAIGVHGVAGLGRARVLVAMALIESGMAPLDSVIFIRERRQSAINARQLKYIETYKRKSKDK
ncbi:protein-tyrosine phosphatase-like protein, partial [Blyttiomyces helicus]